MRNNLRPGSPGNSSDPTFRKLSEPFPIGSMYGIYIYMYNIYANIWGILMVNVTIYSSTMDPMGLELSPGSGWPSCHETEVDLWGDESRSQKWLVRRVWLVWHGIDFGIVGCNMLHRLLYICYNESCSQMSLVLCISVPGFLLQWALLGSNRFLESQGHQVHLLVQWMFELANAPCSSFPSLNPVILSYPNPIHIWFRSIIIIIMIYIYIYRSYLFIYI